MVDLSPKGVLEAIVIFPFMGLLALLLDSLSVVFIIFGLDDFGILDIAGLIIFGTWIFIRSGGERKLTEPPSTKAQKKAALKKAGGIAKRFGKVGTKAGLIALFEFIPYLGTILFGWTGLVIFEFISDLRASSSQAQSQT